MIFRKGDKIKLVRDVRNSNRGFDEGMKGEVICRAFNSSMVKVLIDNDRLICEDSDLKLIKEDNKMNEFKKELETSLESLAKMVSRWEELTTHERATVEQVAQETGFDELGNFEEVVDKFKQFYQQMQRTTVIDGYQVWVTNDRLHFKQASVTSEIHTLEGIKMAINGDFIKPMPKETMLKILEWYIEEV